MCHKNQPTNQLFFYHEMKKVIHAFSRSINRTEMQAATNMTSRFFWFNGISTLGGYVKPDSAYFALNISFASYKKC